ncbi:MYXO-CTERM sorting domain-containing protein [Nostocoides sp. HKS02]|uniref:MYXO-CTERM sorting domain-containing protein n=1 Tax=Nostocoides sp. HKS02 TaxID=1813880 RepID=UPI0012B4DCC5|nr:MYXO-CTERM sorting domain-containing protein [Tetrasphaera sp. HKS02]QGN58616.1 hypothetical protein GKE56_12815 [Tetrasphaera sp. HKS02]
MSPSRRPARPSVAATACLVLLGAGVAVLAASPASALDASPADLPLPITTSAPKLTLPTIPAVPKLPVPTAPTVPTVPSVSLPPVPKPPVLPLPVTTPSVPASLPAPGSTVPVTAPRLPTPAVPSLPSLPGPVASIASGAQSGVGGVTQGLPGGASVAGGGTGSLLNLGVNASPVATACLQAKGTGTAIANVTVTVAGRNVTAPLVQALPGVLAPCPGGGTPATQGLDASVAGLVGACVRVTQQPSLTASVLVLDSELIGTLTRAGVPLQQVVVPCPAGVGGQPGGAGGTPDTGSTGGTGSGGSGPGSTQVPAAGGGLGQTGKSGGSGQGASGADCAAGSAPGWSTFNARTMASIVPNNVPQTLPWLLLAVALLGRRRLAVVAKAIRGLRTQRLRTQT